MGPEAVLDYHTPEVLFLGWRKDDAGLHKRRRAR